MGPFKDTIDSATRFALAMRVLRLRPAAARIRRDSSCYRGEEVGRTLSLHILVHLLSPKRAGECESVGVMTASNEEREWADQDQEHDHEQESGETAGTPRQGEQ